MKDIGKIIVISDLHLGGDNQSDSDAPLLAFLQDDSRFENACLVIAGDMLDAWAHPCEDTAPNYREITERCSTTWNQIKKRAAVTPAFFLNGNHDIDLDLQSISAGKIKQITPEEMFDLTEQRVYIDHGNCVDLFNAKGHSDDETISYPLGYFKTRLNHSRQLNSHKVSVYPMQTDRFLVEAKTEVVKKLYGLQNHGPLTENELNQLLYSISDTLRHGMTRDILERFNIKSVNDVVCVMSNGENHRYGDLLDNYKSFADIFYHHQLLPSIMHEDPLNVPWLPFANSIDVVRECGLYWYAETVSQTRKADFIVLGHTHMNQLDRGSRKNCDSCKDYIYANSGCWCSNQLGPNVTSIEIDLKNDELSLVNEDITWAL